VGRGRDVEYLLHFPTLEKLASQHGLELVAHSGLHAFYEAVLSGKSVVGSQGSGNVAMWKRWLKEMGVTQGTVSEWLDEWQALHLFSLFVFRRVADPAGDSSSNSRWSGSEAAAEPPPPPGSGAPAVDFAEQVLRLS
jgi:hypothetical protein